MKINRHLIYPIQMVLLLLLAALILSFHSSCSKEPLEAPSAPFNATSIFQDTLMSKHYLGPFYRPWVPDTDNGQPTHLLYSKEFGFLNETDTVIYHHGFMRWTFRWQADGFPVEAWKDTSYSLLPDSVPEPLFLEFTFIASGTKLD